MEKKEAKNDNKNNIIEKRENRFNNRVSNHELLKCVKAMEGFPIKLSHPISLPDLHIPDQLRNRIYRQANFVTRCIWN